MPEYAKTRNYLGFPFSWSIECLPCFLKSRIWGSLSVQGIYPRDPSELILINLNLRDEGRRVGVFRPIRASSVRQFSEMVLFLLGQTNIRIVNNENDHILCVSLFIDLSFLTSFSIFSFP